MHDMRMRTTRILCLQVSKPRKMRGIRPETEQCFFSDGIGCESSEEQVESNWFIPVTVFS